MHTGCVTILDCMQLLICMQVTVAINAAKLQLCVLKQNSRLCIYTDDLVIVRLLVATLHLGMTGKPDGSYTQWTLLGQTQVARVVYG